MRWPLKPNRWPPAREQERDLWQEMREVWGRFRERAWEILDLPDADERAIDEIGPNQWDWLTWDMLDQLADEFSEEAWGGATMNAQDYATYEEAVLPQAGRTGFSIGVDRAVQLTQAGESHLPMRGEQATRKFLQEGFDRLSDNGRLRLANILRPGTEYPQSVQSILQQAMQEGENPIKTARTLAGRFNQYERYEFARLARTEVSFAQNRGIVEEWQAEGFSVPPDMQGDGPVPPTENGNFPTPAFHPNCLCSIVPDPDTGYIIYDVAATACEVCQAMLARQQTFITGEYVEPAEPVGDGSETRPEDEGHQDPEDVGD